MARYVDGFLLAVPKRNLAAYRRISQKAGKIWKEYGALEYLECVGDDMKVKGMASFPSTVQAKPGEVVVFSWILYRSKAQRDRVNAKVMKDPRMAGFDPSKMPFDLKRMRYGGFRVFVDLG